MHMIRRTILALALIAGIAPACAQAPAPVPALPDTERRTTYVITGTTCACSVNFALFGDSTDYQNWVEVWFNGTRVNYSDPAFGWAITSPSGTLATLPRPITDAVLTFTTAHTGTVLIVGARRPRRTAQFSESGGVPTRAINQWITDVVATLRELWDKTNDVTGRSVQAPPGETMTVLPPVANRASMGACFDASGNMVPCVGTPTGSFAAGNGVTFTGTNPTTVATNLAAGPNITLTGTNPITISGAYSLSQRGYISGMTLSNNVIAPNTVIDIAVGVATSDNQTTLMSLPTAITKNLNAVWSVGTGNGCADGAGSYTTLAAIPALSTIALFEIERLDTQVVDVVCSLSGTAPTLPGSYTVKRRIGMVVTDGSKNIRQFVQRATKFSWKVNPTDVSATNPGTTLQTATLTVPTGIQVEANFFFYMQSADGLRRCALITSPDQTQSTPAAGTQSSSCTGAAGVTAVNAGQFRFFTNTSGQVYWQLDGSGAGTGVFVETIGWEDFL